jgi:hypothetical protein
MGTNSIDIQQSLKYYAKKRNYFLFFVTSFLLILGIGYFGFVELGVNSDLIVTIYIPIVIAFLIYVIWYRQRYSYYIMQLEYFRMLNDAQGPMTVPRPIFTQSFIDTFKKDGFIEGLTEASFVLYYRFSKKVEGIVNSGQVLEVIVLAKHETVDFYSQDIDKAVQNLYLKYKDEKKVRKQIVLQFKKYTNFDEDAKFETDKIINFKAANNYLVHITVAYIPKQNQIYYLRPIKRYPNKFYYYASTQINKYCGLSED